MPTTDYKLKDGTRVPGTTTVIHRFCDSGPLMFWAFNQGKSGAKSLYEKSEEACDIGTIAHAMVEADLRLLDPKDVYPNADPEIRKKAESAYNEYLQWRTQSRIEIVYTEVNLVSETYRYGGCPDAIGKMQVGKRKSKNDPLVLLDWKTSNGVYPDNAIQLAAYQNLWNENHPDEPLSDISFLCRFSKSYPDYESRKFGALPEAWELFKLYRRAYDLDKELKKRVK